MGMRLRRLPCTGPCGAILHVAGREPCTCSRCYVIGYAITLWAEAVAAL